MHTSPHQVSNTQQSATSESPQPSPYAERVYQGLTIAFMLLLLGSLWLFR